MVYKTFKVDSSKIYANNRYNLPKEDLNDIIPFFNFEGHYDGKVDGLEDTVGVFLTPFIYFPSSSQSQLSFLYDVEGNLDVKIKKSDIENYFSQTSDLEDMFETDLTVGKYVENRHWILQEDKCKFLGISNDRIDIEILINDHPVNVYFKTDVNILIFKKDDVLKHLTELSRNLDSLIHLEINRNKFKVKDKFGDLMADSSYDWIEFYMEFADKLLEYKDKQKELISKIVKTYDKIGMEMATLDRDENERSIIPNEIDPFTVFALFNKQITWENRVKIIKGIKEEFSILSEVPQEFPGIPVVNNLKATFFYFSNAREKDDIPNLWNVFESAINLSKDNSQENLQNFMKYYNKALKQKGIRWNITMALYWIRPYDFINLDGKNRSFLSNPNIFSEEISNEAKKLKNPPEGEDYLKLCTLCKDYLDKTEFNNFAELSAAAYVDQEDTERPDNGMGDNDIDALHYWVYAPGENASKWDELYNDSVMSIGWDIGDLKNYANRKEMNIKLQEIYNDNSNHVNITKALDDIANKIQKGDIIFVKKGRNEIIGKGIVESDYEYDHTKDYPHIRKVKWINVGNWNYDSEYFDRGLPLKTLTDLSDYKGVIDKLNLLIGYDEDEPEETSQYPEYSIEEFLKEVYIDEKDYFTLVNLLKNKKNLIIQGAPGVGKTFMAKRLAYSIIGEKNMSRVMMVQFHQSYSYEDFIMGFRPTKDGFELKNGTFYTFCKKAEIDNENKYFFIIDEINRGNLSKIFGELFMLIESDKRGEDNKIQFLYSDELFCIPENVYIIGLMNTADRSLAMIDYALRRRFAFFDLKPGFQSRGFKEYQEKINDSQFDDLIKVIEQLNEDIKNDDSLGEGFRIGHSFFCDLSLDDLEEKMKFIVEYEIIPLIKEYWFDEEDKINEWSDKLREVVN